MARGKKIIVYSVVAFLGVLLLVQNISAYFVDREVAENVISIGKIHVTLEEDFIEPTNTLSGREFTKAPSLTNDGTKDEFVFLAVTIPKKEITLLNENGTKKMNKSLNEIFQIIAIQQEGETSPIPISPDDYDTVFTYHAGTFGKDNTPDKIGWVFIEAISNSDDTGNTYIFGYNQKLSPNDSTSKLFDKVKLKDFINGEVTGETSIDIQPYAIQADSLKATGLTQNYLNAVTENDLKIIFKVIERKAGTP